MNNTFHEFPVALLSATNLTLLFVARNTSSFFCLSLSLSHHIMHSDLSYTPIGEIPDTVSAFTNLRQLFAVPSHKDATTVPPFT